MQAKKGAVTASCQRCFRQGHWTYECKNDPVFLSRPSRTEILKNPELRPKPLDDHELIPEIPMITDGDSYRDPRITQQRELKMQQQRLQRELSSLTEQIAHENAAGTKTNPVESTRQAAGLNAAATVASAAATSAARRRIRAGRRSHSSSPYRRSRSISRSSSRSSSSRIRSRRSRYRRRSPVRRHRHGRSPSYSRSPSYNRGYNRNFNGRRSRSYSPSYDSYCSKCRRSSSSSLNPTSKRRGRKYSRSPSSCTELPRNRALLIKNAREQPNPPNDSSCYNEVDNLVIEEQEIKEEQVQEETNDDKQTFVDEQQPSVETVDTTAAIYSPPFIVLEAQPYNDEAAADVTKEEKEEDIAVKERLTENALPEAMGLYDECPSVSSSPLLSDIDADADAKLYEAKGESTNEKSVESVGRDRQPQRSMVSRGSTNEKSVESVDHDRQRQRIRGSSCVGEQSGASAGIRRLSNTITKAARNERRDGKRAPSESSSEEDSEIEKQRKSKVDQKDYTRFNKAAEKFGDQIRDEKQAMLNYLSAHGKSKISERPQSEQQPLLTPSESGESEMDNIDPPINVKHRSWKESIDNHTKEEQIRRRPTPQDDDYMARKHQKKEKECETLLSDIDGTSRAIIRRVVSPPIRHEKSDSENDDKSNQKKRIKVLNRNLSHDSEIESPSRHRQNREKLSSYSDFGDANLKRHRMHKAQKSKSPDVYEYDEPKSKRSRRDESPYDQVKQQGGRSKQSVVVKQRGTQEYSPTRKAGSGRPSQKDSKHKNNYTRDKKAGRRGSLSCEESDNSRIHSSKHQQAASIREVVASDESDVDAVIKPKHRSRKHTAGDYDSDVDAVIKPKHHSRKHSTDDYEKEQYIKRHKTSHQEDVLSKHRRQGKDSTRLPAVDSNEGISKRRIREVVSSPIRLEESEDSENVDLENDITTNILAASESVSNDDSILSDSIPVERHIADLKRSKLTPPSASKRSKTSAGTIEGTQRQKKSFYSDKMKKINVALENKRNHEDVLMGAEANLSDSDVDKTRKRLVSVKRSDKPQRQISSRDKLHAPKRRRHHIDEESSNEDETINEDECSLSEGCDIYNARRMKREPKRDTSRMIRNLEEMLMNVKKKLRK